MNLRNVRLLLGAYYTGNKPWQRFTTVTMFHRGKRGPISKILGVVLALLVAFSFCMIMFMLGVNYYSFQQMGILIGLPDLGVFLAEILGFVLLFIFSCMSAGATLYRGRDMQLLMTLPVRESELLFARMSILYFGLLPFYAFAVLPGICIVFDVTGISVPLVLGGLSTLVIGPILPIALGVLLGMCIMRIAKGRKNSALIQVIMIIVVIAVVLFAQGGIMRVPGMEEVSDPQQLVAALGETVSTAYKALVYFALQASMLFSHGGFINPYLAFGLSLVFSIGVTALVMWLLQVTYYSCVSVAQNGENRRRRRVDVKQQYLHKRKRRALFANNSRMITLGMSDLDIIKSSSVFMVELIGELFMPLLLVGIYAISGVLGDLQEVVGMVSSNPWFPVIVGSLLLLFGSFSAVSSTSISREGKHFAVSRTWPVTPRMFVNGKIFIHMVLLYIPYVCYLLFSCWIFHLHVSDFPWMLFLGFFVIFGTGCLQLALDYSRPLLDWTLPQQAMKQNLNVIIGVGIAVAFIAVVGLFALIPWWLGMDVTWSMYIATAVAFAFDFPAYMIAVSRAKLAYSPA